MAILRLPDIVRKSDISSESLIPVSQFTPEELAIYTKLREGEGVTREEIVPIVVERAISRIGTPYDFDFDFANFESLCCSEFSYWAMKSCASHLGMVPRAKRVLGIKKTMLEPDAMLESGMDTVWASRSGRENLAARGVHIR